MNKASRRDVKSAGGDDECDELHDDYRVSTSFGDVLMYIYKVIAPRHKGKSRWKAVSAGLCANAFRVVRLPYVLRCANGA